MGQDLVAEPNTDTRGREHPTQTYPLLLLRAGAVVPKNAPGWVVPAVGVSMLLFLCGLLRALGAFGGTPGGSSPFSLSTTMIVGTLVAGLVGRGVAVLVQAEAAAGLAGPMVKERGRRRTLLVTCLIAQIPTAIRDSIIGLLGVTQLIDAHTLIRLAASPFDPFVLWSCVVFCIAAKSNLRDLTRASRLGLCIGFCGYAYCLKLVMFGLGSLA
jgi:hypothetical protein